MGNLYLTKLELEFIIDAIDAYRRKAAIKGFGSFFRHVEAKLKKAIADHTRKR